MSLLEERAVVLVRHGGVLGSPVPFDLCSVLSPTGDTKTLKAKSGGGV